MREIKFRAWNEENKEMVNITSLIFWHDGGIKLANSGDAHEHKVMQFTGLKDKNGKDVFESDIIKTSKGRIGEIVWSTDRYGYALKYRYKWNKNAKPQTFWKSFSWLANDKFEVIGNIYEHSYLLDNR